MRRVGLPRAAASVAAALWLAGAPSRAEGDDALSPAYLAVLNRYASGQRTAALAEMAAWPEGRLRGELTRLAALRRAARACPSDTCGARSLWSGLPLRAGLMLHVDAALGDWRAGRSARLAESAAAEYVEMMRDDPRHAEFVRRVLESTVAVHHLEMRWGTALDWGERALKIAPGSTVVLLAMAAIEEMAGTLVAPAERPRAPVDPSARRMVARVEADREARDHFRRARELARRAHATDPAGAEARLRLGRLAWRLGELEDAKVELHAIVAGGAPLPLLFLARLFLGGIAEDEGRLEDALAAYEAAVALLPEAQSAGVALSEARHRQGDAPGARRALHAGLAAAGRRKANDPFWDYPFSASTEALRRLETLRGEVFP
jgi:tetratricopeptide (TPR) repeat protein